MRKFAILALFLSFLSVGALGEEIKMAVLAASGKAGSLIVKEALLNKDIELSAFVRNSKKAQFDSKVKVIEKDIFALNSKDLEGFDVIVDAFGEWKDFSLYKKHTEHLVSILKDNNAKFIVVGGAGSLYMDKAHTKMLMDMPDFPKEYLSAAKANAESLEVLRGQKDLHWVYVSPPAEFIATAPKTGKYEIIGEEFKTNAKGESKGSYADFAAAIIEIALDSKYDRQRVGVIEK